MPQTSLSGPRLQGVLLAVSLPSQCPVPKMNFLTQENDPFTRGSHIQWLVPVGYKAWAPCLISELLRAPSETVWGFWYACVTVHISFCEVLPPMFSYSCRSREHFPTSFLKTNFHQASVFQRIWPKMSLMVLFSQLSTRCPVWSQSYPLPNIFERFPFYSELKIVCSVSWYELPSPNSTLSPNFLPCFLFPLCSSHSGTLWCPLTTLDPLLPQDLCMCCFLCLEWAPPHPRL